MDIVEEAKEIGQVECFVSEDLYKTAFLPVAKFVAKMRGSFQDAKDIFHDALIVYHEKSLNPDFKTHSSAEAYITGIAKHLWIRKYNISRRLVSMDSLESAVCIPEDFYPSIDDKRLMRFLEMTGKKCMDLLRLFYYNNFNMKEITDRLGYRNEHSATVQKYKCIEKIRDSVKQKSITYEDFIN